MSSSPDEITLVDAAKEIGFVFIERSPDSVTIMYDGISKAYEILNILEFSSDRKRMSVIIKNPDDGTIRLYMKGADDMVIDRLDYSSDHIPFLAPTKFAVN